LPHGEKNCIINAAKNGVSLDGCTFYITGFPCEECFAMLVQSGAKRIVYGPQGSHIVNEEKMKIVERMKEGQKVEMVKMEKEKIETALKVLKDASIIVSELLEEWDES